MYLSGQEREMKGGKRVIDDKPGKLGLHMLPMMEEETTENWTIRWNTIFYH
jgi:hypothetical protein